jgi:hypothetical protein
MSLDSHFNSIWFNTLFNVYSRLSVSEIKAFTQGNISTAHLSERQPRIKAYENLGLLSDEFIDGFVVDTCHPAGLEVHLINKNGLIYIYNRDSKRAITILGARPGQLKRYYKALGITDYPSQIVTLIQESYHKVVENNINNL